jgi:acetyl-CoA acetyltransferase
MESPLNKLLRNNGIIGKKESDEFSFKSPHEKHYMAQKDGVRRDEIVPITSKKPRSDTDSGKTKRIYCK